MIRAQINIILKDLKKKMVLLVGPRQAGKTTLAKQIATYYQKPIYLNFDQLNDREIIAKQSWVSDTDLLILDELHKMDNWKNYLKGLFDTKPPHLHIFVTGSARLDIYNQVGDSLAGRYFLHRLLPFSLAELKQANLQPDIKFLQERSGFPEPFFAKTAADAETWRLQYISTILNTSIFDIKNIQNLKAFRIVFELLRKRVGSPISYQTIANDAGISPATVKRYIDILSAVYVIFLVSPYSRNIARSLLKEPKVYFFDIGLVDAGPGAKLENLVALSLLKDAYARNDQLAEETGLYYLRTKDGMEVDFAMTLKNEITKIIEVKLNDHNISKALHIFKNKYGFESLQLVEHAKHEYNNKGISVLYASNFLKELYL